MNKSSVLKRIALFILLISVFFAASCGTAESADSQLEIIDFDETVFIEALCEHTRSFDSQFILNFRPSPTLEADVRNAIESAQATRFDCAYNMDSVEWNMLDKKTYIYSIFKIKYKTSVAPRPPVVDINSFDWQKAVNDMLQTRQTEYSVCIHAYQSEPKELLSAAQNSFSKHNSALFQYEIENSSLSIMSYKDYLVPTIKLSYRKDVIPSKDIYHLESLYDGACHIMQSLSDGGEKLTLFVDGLSKESLQLLLWASQINDSADMVEEALSGAGDYYDGDDGSYIAVLSIQYSGTAEKREQCRRELASVLLDIEDDIRSKDISDQAELYRAACAAVTERAEYDFAMSEASIEEKLTPQMRYLRTAYGALCAGQGVCTSYAAALKAVCDRLSLPCWVIMGSYEDSGHAWNAVLLDGKLRYIDPTFYDISNSDTQFLFTPEEYSSRPYTIENGYVTPDWYNEADQSGKLEIRSK